MDAYYTPADSSEIESLKWCLMGSVFLSMKVITKIATKRLWLISDRAFYEEYAPTPVFDDIPNELEPSLTLEDWKYLQSICHFDLGFGEDVQM
ncbi:uncharacterized protein BT62DRAFT_1011803 [Guyanagaster necrorhizus]|uniref:Uncharacterized protein n=1 Tax=Guyanagaster necrorhizus TaxID=856835 RepID=A0A9P7VIA7_9AGAR|nr:uncharacterized protein BT62DRAFT_1011803 [Guyanagaster necrorhizus MCA 3950]KAG7441219.1 hypothetical protein BT62DRAFT_1011803 [Guyanagaster necrorhizus MCA 3950]